MHRRELLRTLGAAGAIALVPDRVFAAWSRLSDPVPPAPTLGTAELALVAALADTVLPRSDTPSASDVGVPAFIDVYVSENYTDDERRNFLAGLARIESRAQRFTGTTFANTTPAWRGEIVNSIESDDRRAEPGRTWWRLKDLIVHGYFTSEPVMKGVLHYEIMPGRFDGDVEIPVPRSTAGGSGDA